LRGEGKFPRIALSRGLGFALLSRMTLDDISAKIKTCALQMNNRYGGMVFDEWAVVSLAENKARVLFYTGPRNDEFLHNFVHDLGPLRVALHDNKFGVGDFEFSRHATGTRIEAFLVLGNGFYLICNNTQSSMDGIAKNSRWLDAQVPFVELAETIRANPLTVSWDTKFIARN
jgi:hypothetical protein